jgi:hypothetical protein
MQGDNVAQQNILTAVHLFSIFKVSGHLIPQNTDYVTTTVATRGSE